MITSWFSLVININLNYSLISIGNTFNSRSLFEDVLTKLFTIPILTDTGLIKENTGTTNGYLIEK